ncbi:MAG: hypothetical protein COV46_07665 [Deltaproteobacteria bacterium CG11_big_fil_rev_8_21_14_0_20_49_13]|nr:MAG: hypothetical protein COV46_07665 [Deltaproteobacteria bacterium CG11_big_fil_rev_8_21_14_0_20_49_13]
MIATLLPWTLFNLLVLVLLAIDLGIFHKKAHTIKLKEALILSLIWTIVALIFNVGIYFWKGSGPAVEFFTGYLIERSLSVDNLFVFLLAFQYFKIEGQYQHKILYWGIVGALVMRAIFIFSGVAIIEKFNWAMYLFGAFLIFTGVKMAFQKDKEIHPENNPVLKLFKKIMPVTTEFNDGKFFKKIGRVFYATPLFVVLIVIETTDVVFAVDSIPAILAITRDAFIVYTSNVFAILGLRALYFALAGIVDLFHYLNYGLAIILSFIGVKMLIVNFYKIPVGIALGVVGVILALSIVASVIWPKKGANLGGAV